MLLHGRRRFFARQLESNAETSKGRSQFVGDVAHQYLLRTHKPFELLCHVIEVVNQALNFVSTKDAFFAVWFGNARGQLSARQGSGRDAQPADRADEQQNQDKGGYAENNDPAGQVGKREVNQFAQIVTSSSPDAPYYEPLIIA